MTTLAVPTIAPSRAATLFDVLRAEWTKFRTTPGSLWMLVAVVVVTVGGAAATAASIECPTGGCTGDPAKISLAGVQLSQAIVAIIGALMVGGEYRTNMIHTTFAATPRRIRVLAAKAIIVIGVVAPAALVSVLGSVLVGRLIVPGQGFTPEKGFAVLSLSDGAVLRATFGSMLYLVLIALFAVGLAVIARDSAATIGIVLGLLYVFAIVAQVVPDTDLQERLKEIAPMTAGLAIQATKDLAKLAISPWHGLAVLAAWAFGSLFVGGLLLKFRDA